MSVRAHRLCDYDGCNSPAALTCPLCKRDSCKQHCGSQYLVVAVVIGNGETNMASFLGKTAGAGFCTECATALNNSACTISTARDKMPLSSLVEPLSGPLIEAAGALLAAKKLAREEND